MYVQFPPNRYTNEEQSDSIPVLLKRVISQDEYKKQDFIFNTTLDPILSQIKRNKDEKFVVIKTLHIRKKELVLSYEKKPRNRLMRILGTHSQNNFLFLSFDMYKTERKYANQSLTSPIKINQEIYNFFGYSKSNLKNYSCYFYKASQSEIVQFFNSLGNFDQIYSISKKAARLSLLYSQSNFVCQLQNQQINLIPDIERDNVCFSDGCGYISQTLARKIKKYIKQTQKQLQYLPSVYQIRIKGIKGVLVLNPNYGNQQIIVRKSMVKFTAKQQRLKQLVLINYSKPSSFAAINQQIIMLLSGLGLSAQIFLQIQMEYLDLLKKAIVDPVKHIQLLKFLGKDQIITQILENQKNVEFKIKSIISEQIYKNIKSKDMKNRLRIPIQKARFLYGVVYPQISAQDNKKLKLKQNQIFLRVTTNKGIVQTIIGKVMVTKNPCYYCGDIRILQAVDIIQEFPYAKKLVDVIIFSTQGEIPVGTTISGSDYDGDQYFVCWDQKLIPKKQIEPYTYPMTQPKKQSKVVTQKDLINYFVRFDRTIVSKINSRFMSFATISDRGVRCDQCVQLGTKLFSQAIDSVNTGQKVYLPDHLYNPNQQQFKKHHIWVRMTQKHQKFFQQQFKFDDQLISSWNVTYQMMLGVIQTYVSTQNYNDYQLFKIIKSWYLSSKSKKYDLFKYVDFSQLSVKQKREIQDLPNFPKQYLGNPFQLSPIFQNQLFKKNNIQFHTYEQRPKKWRTYYKTVGDQIDFEIFEQALSKFNNVLIGIQVNQKVRLVFSLTNMKKYPYSQNYIPNQSLKVYYTGYNQFKEFQIQSNRKYKLFYSDELFQIYQNRREYSFFWFKNNQVSIDLTRFDRDMLRKHQKITKETIKYLQLFVGLSENFKEVQIKKLYVGEFPVKIERQLDQKIQEKKVKPKYKQKQIVPKKKYVEKK